MSIYIDGRDCCQTGQFSQDVADGALTFLLLLRFFGGDLYISISGNGYEKSLCGFLHGCR
ncbi:hypothetical protein AW061_25560 [Escherichia coli]|nr:hypothetical protein AW061_25560 [Escherichia coli]PNO97571.1 hypothetical protein RK56_013030 [Escherichia coli]TJP81289.1 hypothetical protein C9Z74_23920 [Escherichia coli]